ncbi:MAG: hypothetical protein GX217_06390 [Clostridiaceae bacterium]|nr:hypothetical protein [Clostridiaceae bacterium]
MDTNVYPKNRGGMKFVGIRRVFSTEILTDYESRKTVTLEELMPGWWGTNRTLTGQDS